MTIIKIPPAQPSISHSAWMLDIANIDVEMRLDLDAVEIYGADARSSGAREDSNPYLGECPRLERQNVGETWLHASAWSLGWNKSDLPK